MEKTKEGFIAGTIIALFVFGIIADFACAQQNEQVIRITAKRFVYTPRDVTVKKGIPVTIEFTSQDVLHGFDCPDLNIRSDISPGKTTVLRFVPQKVGTFLFYCDNFCGSGHEQMTGTIKVVE